MPASTPSRVQIAPWIDHAVRVLDDAIPLPGTGLRFGADAILGFVLPFVGDALTGVLSVVLIVMALGARVPTVILARMVMNVGVDVVVGAVPILGDAFDFVWKSNRVNLDLLRRFGGEKREAPGPADYALVGLGIAFAVLLVVVPFVIVAWIVSLLAHRLP